MAEAETIHDTNNCPHCNVSLLGEEIPEKSREHFGNSTHFKREHLMQIQGVYDGGLFYFCPDCGGEWSRGVRHFKYETHPEDPTRLVITGIRGDVVYDGFERKQNEELRKNEKEAAESNESEDTVSAV